MQARIALVSVKMKPRARQLLESEAERQDVTIAEVIRRAINNYFQQEVA